MGQGLPEGDAACHPHAVPAEVKGLQRNVRLYDDFGKGRSRVSSATFTLRERGACICSFPEDILARGEALKIKPPKKNKKRFQEKVCASPDEQGLHKNLARRMPY